MSPTTPTYDELLAKHPVGHPEPTNSEKKAADADYDGYAFDRAAKLLACENRPSTIFDCGLEWLAARHGFEKVRLFGVESLYARWYLVIDNVGVFKAKTAAQAVALAVMEHEERKSLRGLKVREE